MFPDYLDDLLDLEEEERAVFGDSVDGEIGVRAYALVTEVFVAKILYSALERGDVELMRRSAEFIERLLGSKRPALLELTSIRITDHLLGYPENWARFQDFAGSRLLNEVEQRSRYYR
ncbi:hypothetical protein [Streptomyces sp. NPDC053541]|uniref:hypothetical protein n=1 Tax=Streptomyces sp. NPDC053541 TaxID=3365709 RepID=UPI0037D94BA4